MTEAVEWKFLTGRVILYPGGPSIKVNHPGHPIDENGDSYVVLRFAPPSPSGGD